MRAEGLSRLAVDERISRFQIYLVKQRLERRYIRVHLHHARHFIRYIDRRGKTLEDIQWIEVTRYFRIALRLYQKERTKPLRSREHWREIHRRVVHRILSFIQGEWPPGSSRHLQAFKTHLEQQKFSPVHVCTHLSATRHFLDYLRGRGIDVGKASIRDMEAFIESKRMHGWKRIASMREAKRSSRCAALIRRFMRMIDPGWPPPEEPATGAERFRRKVHDGYIRWLGDIHGFSKPTLLKNGDAAERFLDWLGDRANSNTLGSLSVSDIDAYLAWRMPGLRRATRRGVCQCLRSFLRYLHAEGWICRDLSVAVTGPPLYAFAEIPRAFTGKQIQKILDATRRDKSPTGIRDYAILMLLATYGIRAGEIVRLRLEDIDWPGDRLRIRQSKTGIESHLPLVPPVGQAILDYLHHSRPITNRREVFLRIRAPEGPLSRGASLVSMIGRRLKQAGIETNGRRGTHAFRFARAISLLHAAVPVKSIGDLLGHQSEESTGIYLRVAEDDLRAVSLEVPQR